MNEHTNTISSKKVSMGDLYSSISSIYRVQRSDL